MTARRPPRLVVDVTQYVSEPATSGIQRVLARLALDWPENHVEGRFGFVDGDQYVCGRLAAFGAVVQARFAPGADGGDDAHPAPSVRETLRRKADGAMHVDDVEGAFDAFLLAEPTWSDESIAVADRLRGSTKTVPFFLYYDSLPLTRPDLYPRRADAGATVTRYFGAVARSDNVAFISDSAKHDFERRVARRRPANATVATPGADGLPSVERQRPSTPSFAVVGTIEPRKRHRLVLDVFEDLWAGGRDFSLVLLGRPGWEDEDLYARLSELARTRPLEWVRDPDDDAIAAALSRSSALLFLSEHEGYGLPVVEALAARCPVIATATTPALDRIADAGQVRLTDVNVRTVRDAVELLADETRNREYRAALEQLELPTWREFGAEIEGWIARSLEARRAA